MVARPRSSCSPVTNRSVPSSPLWPAIRLAPTGSNSSSPRQGSALPISVPRAIQAPTLPTRARTAALLNLSRSESPPVWHMGATKPIPNDELAAGAGASARQQPLQLVDRAHRQRALGAAADDRRPVGHLDGRPVRSGHPGGLDDEGDGGIPGRAAAQLLVPAGDPHRGQSALGLPEPVTAAARCAFGDRPVGAEESVAQIEQPTGRQGLIGP